jgi:rhodanese-related sulfurtransferase
MPFGDLLGLWDGVGLVVAREPIHTWPIRAAAYLEQGAFLFLVALALGAARCAWEWFGLGNRRLWSAVTLVFLAQVLALVHYLVQDEGFFRNPNGLVQVIGQHFKPELPTVSVAEIASMAGVPGLTIVDARSPQAYAEGHLTGAINVPIYAGPAERAERLAAVSPANRVVVYCQNINCHWAEVIASDIYFRGYQRVCVFPGGWNEWQQHEQSKILR